MRVVELAGAFGLENLRMAERPEPTPGPRQAVIAVRAASLNFRDLLMIEGLYNPRQPLPLIPLSDGAGEVIAVGEGCRRVKVGDRVTPHFFPTWLAGEPTRATMRPALGGPLDGALTEQWCLDEDALVQVPDHLSDEEASTLPCAAVTAWNALTVRGSLGPADTVLLQGTGGVSLFALQLAKALGARVIITSSSDEKLEKARALGADHTLNYRQTPEWGKQARALSGRDGVDLVVEIGGAGTLEQSLVALRPGGQVSLVGVLAGSGGALNLLPILMQNVRVQGITVGDRESFEAMNRALTQHRIRPIIERVFPLEAHVEALEALRTGRHMGKYVVRVGGD